MPARLINDTELSQLIADGKTPSEAAKELGVTRSCVSKALKRLSARNTEPALTDAVAGVNVEPVDERIFAMHHYLSGPPAEVSPGGKGIETAVTTDGPPVSTQTVAQLTQTVAQLLEEFRVFQHEADKSFLPPQEVEAELAKKEHELSDFNVAYALARVSNNLEVMELVKKKITALETDIKDLRRVVEVYGNSSLSELVEIVESSTSPNLFDIAQSLQGKALALGLRCTQERERLLSEEISELRTRLLDALARFGQLERDSGACGVIIQRIKRFISRKDRVSVSQFLTPGSCLDIEQLITEDHLRKARGNMVEWTSIFNM